MFSQGHMIDDRDFLVAHRRVSRADGSEIFIERSVIRNDFPEVKHCIRCDMPFQVRMFKPMNNGRIAMISMNMTNMKGKIPSWYTNKLNKSYSAEENFKIQGILEREYAHHNTIMGGNAVPVVDSFGNPVVRTTAPIMDSRGNPVIGSAPIVDSYGNPTQIGNGNPNPVRNASLPVGYGHPLPVGNPALPVGDHTRPVFDNHGNATRPVVDGYANPSRTVVDSHGNPMPIGNTTNAQNLPVVDSQGYTHTPVGNVNPNVQNAPIVDSQGYTHVPANNGNTVIGNGKTVDGNGNVHRNVVDA